MINNIDPLMAILKTPVDLTKVSNVKIAEILTLHFIGYLAKPIGISEELYLKCLESFNNNNRGKVERETEVVLMVLNEDKKSK